MTTWLPIPGFAGYEVSDEGQVRSFRKSTSGPRILRPARNRRNDYRYVSIVADGGKHTSVHVHRLVMLAFVGPKPDGLQTRHLDGDTENNRLDNLTYGTAKENAADKVRHGTHFVPARGPRRVASRKPGELTTSEVAERLHYTVNSVNRLCRVGQLPARRSENVWLVPESALDTFVYPTLGRPRKAVAA